MIHPARRRLVRGLLFLTLAALSSAYGLAGASNPKTGRVFVFSGATGLLIRTLTAPDPVHRGRFGAVVASAGLVNADLVPDIAVGAPGVHEGQDKRAGRAYIFSGLDGSLIRTLSAPSPARKVRFGSAVAAAGDLDGDGAGDLIIGAPRAVVPGAGRAGEAYLFSGASGAVLAPLAAPSPRKGSRFGWSVAAGSDANGDGNPELLVGAPREKVGSREEQGRVYMFDPNGLLLAAFDDPVPQRSALFGDSLSYMDDADGDGLAEIVVGADGQHLSSGDYAGRVFILRGTDPLNPLVAHRTALTPGQQANFGFAVIGLPDLDGDGRGDLAATAPDQTTTHEIAGAGFSISGDPDPNLSSPIDYTIAGLDDPEPHRLAFFGGSIAALRDLTGDGLSEVVVGAELHKNSAGFRTGRAYVLQGVDGTSVFTLRSPTGDTCSRFGWSVAAAGDVDGDTVADIVVGAPFHRAAPRQIRGPCS
jgi:hypothetical protein